MSKTKKRLKRKIRIKESAKLKKKNEQPEDSLKRMNAQMPRTTAPVMRVKIRKK